MAIATIKPVAVLTLECKICRLAFDHVKMPGCRGRNPVTCSPECKTLRIAQVAVDHRFRYRLGCEAINSIDWIPASSDPCGLAFVCEEAGTLGRSIAKPEPKQLRPCAGCGVPFIPKQRRHGVYCGRDCFFEAHAVDEAIRKENKRADKRLRNQRLKEERHAKPPRPFPCKQCGKLFSQRRRHNLLCSPECVQMSAQKRSYPNKTQSGTCAECNAPFVNAYGEKRKRFCSNQCGTRSCKRVRRHRLRAAERGVPYQIVNVIDIFERDGWRCQICRKLTPQRLQGTIHKRAPSLDHIQPVSLGGAHEPSNLQLACRECNSIKGAKPLGQTVLL